ncbi:uncharacterized protein LOC132747992 [Ruditapes philippinarum]|uniref:uncharacterized protein LOC132747992 n=1 Tax=Ruditapes philippinarum TaxID=129788 RepID=UPI00295A5DB4|nr:uncharacterized protein LOC132747992 [Ruditapes philippinarum]
MADDDGDGLSEVDKGTILMLCLSLGLAVFAGFWFGCKWYRKKHGKPVETRTARPRLKQTFSRFSQVDEELTMHHITEEDTEILQSYSGTQEQHKEHTVHMEMKTSPVLATRASSETKKKPYLETDI